MRRPSIKRPVTSASGCCVVAITTTLGHACTVLPQLGHASVWLRCMYGVVYCNSRHACTPWFTATRGGYVTTTRGRHVLGVSPQLGACMYGVLYCNSGMATVSGFTVTRRMDTAWFTTSRAWLLRGLLQLRARHYGLWVYYISGHGYDVCTGCFTTTRGMYGVDYCNS